MAWDGTPYQQGWVADRVVELGVGLVRDRFAPGSRHQEEQMLRMGQAGVGLCLFLCDGRSTGKSAAAYVQALAASPLAPYVRAVLGNNEPNGNGGSAWPDKVVSIQRGLQEGMTAWPPGSDVVLVSPALMHNVGRGPDFPQYDLDLGSLKTAAGDDPPWQHGDHHFYPGNGGPVLTAAQAQRARDGCYGDVPLWQTETGWTEDQTDRDTAARFTVETYLRNYIDGIVATLVYELCDDPPEGGHSGRFGLVEADGTPKPSYLAVQRLLATPDGGEAFPGWLQAKAHGDPFDAQAVVTSEGAGRFTVYLLRNSDSSATIVLPTGWQCDTGTPDPGSAGQKVRYDVDLTESMIVAQVTRAA